MTPPSTPLPAPHLAYAVTRYREGYSATVIAAALHIRRGRIIAGLISAGVKIRDHLPAIPPYEGPSRNRPSQAARTLWHARIERGWR